MEKSIVPVNEIAVRSSTCYEFSNSNPAEVVEIEDDDTSVETVEKQLEDLKLSHQFNEEDVPEIFKSSIKYRMHTLKAIVLRCCDSFCTLQFDDFFVRFEKKNDNWTVTYKEINTKIEAVDPEKSAIDHLWFVLRNSKIKLEKFGIYKYSEAENRHSLKIDFKKLDTLLHSMIVSIDHQIQTTLFICREFNEDTFISMLERVKPLTLEKISFIISWKEEGNYQKMQEIVETDQWKQAKSISSPGVTPLKMEDLFQYKIFGLGLDHVTPADVLRASEHVMNSADKSCILSCEDLDIDAIMDVLRSQNDGSEYTQEDLFYPNDKFCYKVVKSKTCIFFSGTDKYIVIHKARNFVQK